MGDLNATSSTDNDFALSDKADSRYIPVPYDNFCDTNMLRSNSDKRNIDEHGKMVLDMCIVTGLRILNGCRGTGILLCVSHVLASKKWVRQFTQQSTIDAYYIFSFCVIHILIFLFLFSFAAFFFF